MSLYNLLHGQNPLSDLFLGMLDLTEESVGRFRDVYIEKENDKYVIVVYTRNGEGNRECWGEDKDDCDCPGCIIERKLPQHPNYIRDYDDDFDCTYASIVFSVPTKYVEYVEHVYELMKDKTKPPDKFKELIDKLGKDDNDPTVKHAIEVGKAIFKKVDEMQKKGKSGIVEV